MAPCGNVVALRFLWQVFVLDLANARGAYQLALLGPAPLGSVGAAIPRVQSGAAPLAHLVEQLPRRLQPSCSAEHRVKDDAQPELFVFCLGRRRVLAAPDGEHWSRNLLAGLLYLFTRLD